MKFSETYRAFGLTLQSEFALPELPIASSSAEPDVQITVGEIGAGILSPQGHGALWKTVPGQMELNVPGIGRYLVSQGKKIQIEPARESTEAALRTMLLGSVAGALLQQRGHFVLHAGGFVHNRSAVLICGRSGAGKSTVLQGMARRGYATLSDDLLPISLDADESPIASPGYPYTRLCRDAATYYGVSQDSPRFLTKSGRKFVLEIDTFDPTTRPISHIFCLNSYNRDEVDLKPTSALKAGSLLSRFSYRSKFLQGMGLLAPHFDFTVKIARKVPVTLVRRPRTLETLDHLLDRIEATLAQPSA